MNLQLHNYGETQGADYRVDMRLLDLGVTIGRNERSEEPYVQSEEH